MAAEMARAAMSWRLALLPVVQSKRKEEERQLSHNNLPGTL